MTFAKSKLRNADYESGDRTKIKGQFFLLLRNSLNTKFQPFSVPTAILLPEVAIAQFCQRWKIQEFYLFGSVLRQDFHADSDIDVMVEFAPDARWGFEIVDMKQELEEIFDRKVDFLTKKAIDQSENWIRRKEILETTKLVYVQR